MFPSQKKHQLRPWSRFVYFGNETKKPPQSAAVFLWPFLSDSNCAAVFEQELTEKTVQRTDDSVQLRFLCWFLLIPSATLTSRIEWFKFKLEFKLEFVSSPRRLLTARTGQKQIGTLRLPIHPSRLSSSELRMTTYACSASNGYNGVPTHVHYFHSAFPIPHSTFPRHHRTQKRSHK